MSRIGHVGPRHPLCPECGYDLVATVAENGRTCPECGYAFELDEVRREVREDDWTVARGLRRAFFVLGARLVVSLAAWGLLVLVVDLLYGWLVTPGSGMIGFSILITLCVVLATAGGIMGDKIVRRLDEYAGFQSLLLYFAAIVTVLLAMTGGTTLVDLMRPLSVVNDPRVIVFIGGSVATVWIIRCALVDED